LTRMRTFLVVCALALPIPAAIAGCGGGDSGSGEDPQTVLDETFNNDTKVTSGDLNLSVSVNAEGSQGGQFQASLTGPFQGDAENPNTLPQLDWQGSISGSGAGQNIDYSAGLTITDDNAYVTWKDQPYEVGTKEFAQIKSQVEQQAGSSDASPTSFAEGCKQAIEQAGGDASACDIDFESWITNLTNEGDADVGGTNTTHISGDADVSKILSDIGNIASSIPSAASSGFDPSQLGLASAAVKDASIDVYSGADDHVLRKLDANLTVDPSALGASSDQIGQITVSFSVEIDGLNEDQTITAPENAKPISELLQSSGIDLGALGGSLGGSTGTGSSGSGSGSSSSDYLNCIQQAQTADQINQCAAQL
jgi:hypothetical protein